MKRPAAANLFNMCLADRRRHTLTSAVSVLTIEILALQVEAAAERGGCSPRHAVMSQQSLHRLACDSGSCAAAPPGSDAHGCLDCLCVLHQSRRIATYEYPQVR